MQLRMKVRSVFVLVAAATAVACSEPGPSEIEISRSGALLTLSTSSGSFSLNLETQQLSDGSGRVIDLTSAQTAELSTAMNEIIYAEGLGNQLAASPPPVPMCGPNPCMDELRASPSVGSELRADGGQRGRRGFGRDIVSRKRVRTAGTPSDKMAPTAELDLGFTSVGGQSAPHFEGPWACVDIAEAIYNVRQQLNESKVTIGSVLWSIFSSIEFETVGGILRGTVGASEWLTAGVVSSASTNLSRSVALSFLAAMYSAHNCWSNSWPDRGSFSGGFGSGGGGGGTTYTKVCTDEQWEISYDGGVTWQAITVSVCEYVPQQS